MKIAHKKVRLPKQAHKNTDSDSRQTNFTQNGVAIMIQVESAFYQIQQYHYDKNKYNYSIKKKITPLIAFI